MRKQTFVCLRVPVCRGRCARKVEFANPNSYIPREQHREKLSRRRPEWKTSSPAIRNLSTMIFSLSLFANTLLARQHSNRPYVRKVCFSPPFGNERTKKISTLRMNPSSLEIESNTNGKCIPPVPVQKRFKNLHVCISSIRTYMYII